jgi:chromosome segregation ATPase
MTRDYDIHPDEVNELRAEIERLRSLVKDLVSNQSELGDEIRRLRREIKSLHLERDRPR